MGKNIKIILTPDRSIEALYVDNKFIMQFRKIRIKDLVEYCPIHDIAMIELEDFNSESDNFTEEFQDLVKYQIKI